MTVAVIAGFEHLIDDDNVPWEIVAGDDELEREFGEAVRCSVVNSREQAHNSRGKAGVYQGAHRQKVLSVKLSDYCGHDEANWQDTPDKIW